MVFVVVKETRNIISYKNLLLTVTTPTNRSASTHTCSIVIIFDTSSLPLHVQKHFDMALYLYFNKKENLPNPNGPLEQSVPSSLIEAANTNV